jgi:hypothetical protein
MFDIKKFDESFKDIDTTKPLKEKKTVPDGEYVTKITEAGWGETKLNKKAYLGMTHTITAGDYKGEKLYKKCFIENQFGLYYLKRDLAILGVVIDKLSSFEPVELLGQTVVVEKVTKPSKDGKEYANINYVSEASPAAGAATKPSPNMVAVGKPSTGKEKVSALLNNI